MGASQKDIDPSGDTRIQMGVTCSPPRGLTLPMTPSTRLTTGDFQLRRHAGRPHCLLVFSASFVLLPPPLPSSESFPLRVADTSQPPRFHCRTVGFHHNRDGCWAMGNAGAIGSPQPWGRSRPTNLYKNMA